jgi:hypothetical protein
MIRKRQESLPRILTTFPGVQLIIDDDVIIQEAKFCCRFTIRGTHKDELMGILPQINM